MTSINDKIKEIHHYDQEQLDIIFSREEKIIVEAPAGCGKTKTLVSKIAYLLSEKAISNNKKILALTFGVNAAYKIRREVFANIPNIISSNATQKLEKKIFVTNFHGLARRILSKYGYLIHDNFLKLNEFNVVDDSKAEFLIKLNIGVLESDAQFISDYSSWIKLNDISEIEDNFNKYLELIIEKFIPNKYITYNAILMVTIKLLNENKQVLDFYQKLFPYIIIDEFQDTGILSWKLLNKIIRNETSLLFMGDPLQRIYGFIGAVPNLMDKAREKYTMQPLRISTNYRFKDNKNMLLLDKNIRENSNKTPSVITEDAVVPFNLYQTQTEEANYIVKKLKYLLENESGSKIVILAQSRTKNLNFILEQIHYNSIHYFNGLFSEESSSYKKFHQDAVNIFIILYQSNKSKTISKTFLNKVLKQVSESYESKPDNEISPLITLLRVFFEHLFTDNLFMNNEDKYNLIIDTLSNNALKQSMEHLDERIIVTTVHGAKGLEWDYVMIPDMERNSFPNYMSLCASCEERTNNDACNACYVKMNNDETFHDKYLEILSIFYVAITRAKKQVFFSASLETLNNPNYPKTKYSCLLSLPGIKLKQDIL